MKAFENRYRLGFVVSIFLGLIVFCGESIASSEELASIRQAIREAGASWTAAENWITELPPAERKMLLGGNLPSPKDISPDDIIVWPEVPDPRAAASSMDWRNYGGHNWMTSVKNQKNCGSCAAFAACGAVEAGVRIAVTNPSLNIDLSEQHLFSCGGGSCTQGWYLDAAIDFFKSYGVPDEACLPYSAVDNNCSATCNDWQSRAVKISNWQWVTQATSNETAIKNALLERPIPCRMEVYEDFHYYTSGVYTQAWGSNLGGHFVVIVGWNDQENTWICKNSWGPNWGESGYFRIRRDQVLIGTFAVLTFYDSPPPPTPPPSQAQLYFRMPKTYFYPGDVFYVDAIIDNPGPTQYDAALFVALNIYDDFWFWPTWVHYPDGLSWGWIDMNHGAWYWEVMPAFQWPQIYASMSNLLLIGATLDNSMNHLLTNVAAQSWGFGY